MDSFEVTYAVACWPLRNLEGGVEGGGLTFIP